MGESERRPDRGHADGPVVGLTGARFGGTAGRRRRLTERAPLADPEPQHPTPEPQYPTQPIPVAAVTDSGPGEFIAAVDCVDEAEWILPEEVFDLVRPYSRTGGRTAASHDLAVEALISATARVPDPAAGPEHHAIHGLCATPRSVAELAALLSVPLGVVRVVLGDMTTVGSVVVHDTAGSADGTPDLALMQRVLSCLQRL